MFFKTDNQNFKKKNRKPIQKISLVSMSMINEYKIFKFFHDFYDQTSHAQLSILSNFILDDFSFNALAVEI